MSAAAPTPTISPFATATEMCAALRARRISSVELYELHVERIVRLNPALNAIVIETFERGRREAAAADSRLAQRAAAPLLGLPITLKESQAVAGLPQSAGIGPLADYRPPADSVVVRRLLESGTALLGKTNVPQGLGDWQANSPVYGRTNNPWNLERTPGGSTGGGSAALAAGLTPLELGSDIGGSIRVPAAFTGVYGHRPSENAIPRTGAFPRADLPNPASVMGVQGPLARSALDLELAFDVIAGPDVGDDVAWRLELPPARRTRLADFRVAVLPALPAAPVQPAVRARMAALEDWLRSRGAEVREAAPALDWQRHFADYVRLLMAQTTLGQSADRRAADAAAQRQLDDPVADAIADGLTLDYPALVLLLARRAQTQRVWERFFRDWDVLLTPAFATTAFPHRDDPHSERTVVVEGQTIPYLSLFFHPHIAVYCGLPATAFPAGFDDDGLPVGLQAVGPYLEDRTPLRFAQLLEREWCAFTPPPEYAGG